MVKIRLQRHGRKQKPFYYIVAADVRAPRDGRYIERIGSYNPNTNPATIDLDLDASVRWLQNGAVPTDTCRAILSYKGAIHKNHLLNGVRKGAFTEDEALKRFDSWLEQKHSTVGAKRDALAKAEAERLAEAHKREEEVRVAREKAIAERNSPVAEEVAEETAEEAVEEGEVAEVEASAEATEVAESNEEAAEATEETEQ